MAGATPVLAGGLGTAVALPVVEWWLVRRSVVDAPNERSSHHVAAVRGLGLACVIGWVIAIPFADEIDGGLWALIVAPVAVAVVGLLDDLTGGLSAALRFAAVGAISLGATAHLVIELDEAAIWVVLGAIWVLYFTNAFNFMDGIDAVSATTTVVAAAGYAAVADRIGASELVEVGVTLAVLGLVFGARNILGTGRFLGDAGSYFFGSALALLALTLFLAGAAPVAAASGLVIYVADTSLAIIRRAARGETLSEAHRQHVYQQLVDNGTSHVAMSIAVGAATGACCLLGLWSETSGGYADVFAACGLLAVAAAYLVLPSALLSDRNGMRQSSQWRRKSDADASGS